MPRRLLGCLSLIALSGSFLSPFASLAHADEVPSLQIGEIAWAGSSLSSADEWIELWNLSDSPLSLAGYRLEGASASPIVFDDQAIIGARDVYLIANYSSNDEKSSLATKTHLVTTALSLSNSQLAMKLFDASSVLVDELPDGTPPAGSSSPKASMIRVLAEEPLWQSATETRFMKAGITDLGTPGYCDGCTELPIVEAEEILPEEILPEPVPEEIPEIATEEATEETVEEIATEPAEEPVEEEFSEPIPEETEEPVSEESTVIGEEGFVPAEIPTEIIIEIPPEQPIEETLITVNQSIETPVITPPKPRLRLQAVFPAPDNAYEWIDLAWTTETKQLAPLDGWFIQNNRNNTIFRFSTSTRANLIEHDELVRITLKSSVLLNTGDTLSLFDETGALVDRMSYSETPKGSTWIFDGVWMNPDLIPPPAEEEPVLEIISTPIPTTAMATATVAIINTPTSKTSLMSVAPKTASPANATKTTSTTTKITIPKTSTTKTAAAKTAATKSTTTKTATLSKTAIANIIHPSTIEDILMQPQSWRVRVQGIVGTVPGILLKRQFILQAPDGRGLLVKVPTGQKTPLFGSTVELTGDITNDDDGILLTMKSDDAWTMISENSPAIPSRSFDLLAEEPADAWSKLSVTGTIMSIAAGKAAVNIDGIHVTVTIKAATRYRVQRLKEGDLVAFTGVLNFTNDGPILYPVTAEDIVIIQSASELLPATTKNTMPDWIPFGAAGVTVAAYEGLKRWRKQKPVKKSIVTIT